MFGSKANNISDEKSMEICTEFLVVEYTVASGKEFMLLLGKIRQQTCPVFQTCRGPAEPSTWNRFD